MWAGGKKEIGGPSQPGKEKGEGSDYAKNGVCLPHQRERSRGGRRGSGKARLLEARDSYRGKGEKVYHPREKAAIGEKFREIR